MHGARTDVHLPLLPFQLVPVHREAHALGLHDVQRLDIRARFVRRVLGEEVGEEVVSLQRRGDALSARAGERVLR